jgi:hypothetical protein
MLMEPLFVCRMSVIGSWVRGCALLVLSGYDVQPQSDGLNLEHVHVAVHSNQAVAKRAPIVYHDFLVLVLRCS